MEVYGFVFPILLWISILHVYGPNLQTLAFCISWFD